MKPKKKKETMEKIIAEIPENRMVDIKGGGMINAPAQPMPVAPGNNRDKVQKMFDALEDKYK